MSSLAFLLIGGMISDLNHCTPGVSCITNDLFHVTRDFHLDNRHPAYHFAGGIRIGGGPIRGHGGTLWIEPGVNVSVEGVVDVRRMGSLLIGYISPMRRRILGNSRQPIPQGIAGIYRGHDVSEMPRPLVMHIQKRGNLVARNFALSHTELLVSGRAFLANGRIRHGGVHRNDGGQIKLHEVTFSDMELGDDEFPAPEPSGAVLCVTAFLFWPRLLRGCR